MTKGESPSETYFRIMEEYPHRYLKSTTVENIKRNARKEVSAGNEKRIQKDVQRWQLISDVFYHLLKKYLFNWYHWLN